MEAVWGGGLKKFWIMTWARMNGNNTAACSPAVCVCFIELVHRESAQCTKQFKCVPVRCTSVLWNSNFLWISMMEAWWPFLWKAQHMCALCMTCLNKRTASGRWQLFVEQRFHVRQYVVVKHFDIKMSSKLWCKGQIDLKTRYVCPFLHLPCLSVLGNVPYKKYNFNWTRQF